MTFESYREVAEAIRSNQKLYLDGGFLLTCPNPEPLENVDEAVETAVREVTENCILGKEVTPYILKRGESRPLLKCVLNFFQLIATLRALGASRY